MMYHVQIKHGCKWLSPHEPYATKPDAYRAAMRIYGAIFWKQFLGGSCEVRVVKL